LKPLIDETLLLRRYEHLGTRLTAGSVLVEGAKLVCRFERDRVKSPNIVRVSSRGWDTNLARSVASEGITVGVVTRY
jgi:hypothetical protein